MKLSRDEEVFLRHWMYDEAHYEAGRGPAKELQVRHRAAPADMAVLIAAAIPDPDDQEAAGLGPPPAEPATWPWPEEVLRSRLAEARAALGADRRDPKSGAGIGLDPALPRTRPSRADPGDVEVGDRWPAR